MLRPPLIPALSLLIAAAAAAVGCGKGGEPRQEAPARATVAAASTWPATARSDRGNFEVTLRPSEGVIERNRHFSIDVTIEAIDGASPDEGDLKVTVDADMPAHRHGMNTRPELVAEGTRRYRVDGMLFHMAGDWIITVDIVGGTESERAAFPVHVE